ncbi:MAG: S-methyl-5-thioribose-1-phosphate isomerase [Acidobacteriota bacterium]|jgi:methylthioribose-1-phosphate isomerase|nr:S-methyl-5-thioribose-1-phosphate isomerase [Acidobacteriota bacterium]
MHPVIEWKDNQVVMLDQRLLPLEEKMVVHRHYTEVADSIRRMVIRGAPAIGVAAAMGVALGVVNASDRVDAEFPVIIRTLAATRPTAVNLFWALERMQQVYEKNRHNPGLLQKAMIREALAMDAEDVAINRRLGVQGAELLQDKDRVLTHCNAGALATAGYGTALGVIRAAVDSGKQIQVVADETRPFLQGSRLTAWELSRDRIPVTLITDSMAGSMMRAGRIDAVIVGADRIARNGDVANKIGTYSVAVLAHHHRIPFYVAAPISTIDPGMATGEDIPIEERDADEVRLFHGVRVAAKEIPVFNPAFDVTPHELVTAIISEKGVARGNFSTVLEGWLSG